ncbi:MAG: glycosyltransferase [Nitrososphaerota archaeon]|nr:glycosyltransferase [Nitrososphaerota archaeon]MDG7048900.1 glycosyltransferase [Nitrososphaerota archaeon]MDG7052237.1 glycosyltransferase [Nitrososphaerota archaeon]
MSLKVSVIITAHDRRRYLKEAIRSVIEQELNSAFEVIVVKNFDDKDIDSYMAEHGVIGILCKERNVGEKLADAITRSSGDIISFLDDDDMFYPGKLKVIVDEFTKHKEVNFYHNMAINIDSNGEPITHHGRERMYDAGVIYIDPKARPSVRMLEALGPGANMSSISIRRDVVNGHIGELRSIILYPDAFIYGISLAMGVRLEYDFRVLTKYRVHMENYNSLRGSRNLKEYLRTRSARLEILLHDQRNIIEAIELIDKRSVAAELFRNNYAVYQISYWVNKGENRGMILKEYLRILFAGYLWSFNLYLVVLTSARVLSYALLPESIAKKVRLVRAAKLFNRKKI